MLDACESDVLRGNLESNGSVLKIIGPMIEGSLKSQRSAECVRLARTHLNAIVGVAHVGAQTVELLAEPCGTFYLRHDIGNGSLHGAG